MWLGGGATTKHNYGNYHSRIILICFLFQKLFYSKKCGAIRSVKIEKHRKKKAVFAKANYALVEFAHKDSVEVCVPMLK